MDNRRLTAYALAGRATAPITVVGQVDFADVERLYAAQQQFGDIAGMSLAQALTRLQQIPRFIDARLGLGHGVRDHFSVLRHNAEAMLPAASASMPDVPPCEMTCMQCGEFARTPYQACWHCGDAPSDHHAWCCLQRPQTTLPARFLERERALHWPPPRDYHAWALERQQTLPWPPVRDSTGSWQAGWYSVTTHAQYLQNALTETRPGSAAEAEADAVRASAVGRGASSDEVFAFYLYSRREARRSASRSRSPTSVGDTVHQT